jgi:hypothetical protein
LNDFKENCDAILLIIDSSEKENNNSIGFNDNIKRLKLIVEMIDASVIAIVDIVKQESLYITDKSKTLICFKITIVCLLV